MAWPHMSASAKLTILLLCNNRAHRKRQIVQQSTPIQPSDCRKLLLVPPSISSPPAPETMAYSTPRGQLWCHVSGWVEQLLAKATTKIDFVPMVAVMGASSGQAIVDEHGRSVPGLLLCRVGVTHSRLPEIRKTTSPYMTTYNKLLHPPPLLLVPPQLRARWPPSPNSKDLHFRHSFLVPPPCRALRPLPRDRSPLFLPGAAPCSQMVIR